MSEENMFDSPNTVNLTVTIAELAVIIYGITEVGIKNAEAMMIPELSADQAELLADADKALNKLYANLVDVFDIAVL